MKNKPKILFAFVLLSSIGYAQSTTKTIYDSGWHLNVRGGYDIIPMYDNNTPYIDYKGGLELGATVNYYWNWIGIGADFDYIKNKPKSTYPTDNLFFGTNQITNFSLSEDGITRIFYGIGPSFKYQKNNRFSAEFWLRGGLASIKGGRTELTGTLPGTPPTTTLLNFHAGYDESTVFSGKAQLQANYWITDGFGIHAGVYYMRHFGVEELVDPTYGISAGYYGFTNDVDVNNLSSTGFVARQDACNCDISSIGVFAGLSFRFPQKQEVKEECNECQLCPVCGKNHALPMCACLTCGCKLSITAKDKFSNEILPDTDIILVNSSGQTVSSGKTNGYGVVIFDNVKPDTYSIKGKLYKVNLQDGTVDKSEFENCSKNNGIIEKEILYADEDFVLKGSVLECNSTKSIEGANINLKGKTVQTQDNTISDKDGKYLFHVNQKTDYILKGNKDGYFSNEVELTTNDYNRSKSLFIDFKMCIDPCGKAIRLNNIIFNLAKWDILPASEADLNYVVKLLQQNPKIKVELSSHTDSRASKPYNQTLSQKRAQSSVNYIVGKGIAADRIIARGAGETELLNKCADGIPCTEAEHTINRRTEFKVICQ